jgi:hypothetical protein
MENDLVKMYGVPDTFCDGLARIDKLGPCQRLTFVVREITGNGRLVVAKLILPAEGLVGMLQTLRGAQAGGHKAEQVTARLVQLLWLRLGRGKAYRSVDQYVIERVRRFLAALLHALPMRATAN